MGTIVHTQGQGNRPREKTFIVEREEYPLICLLDHLLYLAVYDDVLVSPELRTVDNVFGTIVPLRKNSLQLKIKREVFDLPVFREPSRIVGRKGIRQFTALRSSTWLRYLQRLGRSCGLGRPFTQYCARRGLINAVNNKAPSSVRDQVFDHQLDTVRYYLDREVQFNTMAAFLGRPSKKPFKGWLGL
ncbi:MAG: hypothetical protein M1830_006950 [Pleopsidium flavum]|nr:MAG: hypothetical protein M1830_006950 [Pleopsidium flavum]